MSPVRLPDPRDAQEGALAALLTVPAVADELGRRFAAAGHELHLVGGWVRDAILGREAAGGATGHAASDLDFATDARPEKVLQIVRGWAEGVWEVGIAFGTVGLLRAGQRLEVTTYRAEAYDKGSRNPQVSYGERLEGDLARRDFTINAMAVSVPDHVYLDPYGGLRDLAAGLLRTPGRPEDSFDDDPLRMLRAARFAAQLGVSVAPEVVAAMTRLAGRLSIVAVERIRDELVKTMLSADPVRGLELLVDTGLAEQFLPELPALRLSADPLHHHKDVYRHTLAVLERAIEREPAGPDLVVRLAALLHDIGKPATKRAERGTVTFHHHEVVGANLTRRRMAALRFDREVAAAVEKLVFLHLRFHGYAGVAGPTLGGVDSAWTDSAVRRYVVDAGDQLARLHLLVRSDCTTRNRRKAAALDAAYDDLERRIVDLRQREQLDAIRPDLDGRAVMQILGVAPGPLVGKALAYLLELRMEAGPLGPERAEVELRAWAARAGGPAVEPPGSAGEPAATGPASTGAPGH